MKNTWRPRRFEIVVVGGLILGLYFVLLFSFERARNAKRQQTCLSNLKQVHLAAMQYVRDYDEKYPLANHWSQVLPLYAKSEAIFHCPSAANFGYSMNTHLSGLNIMHIVDSRTTPLYFDSSTLKKSQYDDGVTWPKDARHPQGNAVVFMDGHVKLQMQKPLFHPFVTHNTKP